MEEEQSGAYLPEPLLSGYRRTLLDLVQIPFERPE
jgi:hypothetical protein